MKTLQTILVSLVLISILNSELRAAPTVVEIMEQMETLQELNTDIISKVKMTHQEPDQGVKVLESVYYRRDEDDAFLVVLTAPDSEKGNGYLRVGDNMWMYRRNTRTFQMMSRNQSIGGTQVKSGDMEKRKFTELFEPSLDEDGNEILSEETLGKAKIEVYRIDLTAKVKDVEYPKVVYWVRRDNFLPIKEAAYSLSGTLMETSYFPKYTIVEGKYLPVKMIIVDEFEKGKKTIVEISGISLEKIDDSVFTKAYLENLSK